MSYYAANQGGFIVQYRPQVTHAPAHFLRARSARHLQQTRNEARVK
jgi:hypothetical protein